MTLIPSLTFTDYEWFPWSICNGCGMPAGNAYPSGHLVPSPILGLASAPIVETKFLELAMSLLDFSPRIPLGTFSILLFDQKSESLKKENEELKDHVLDMRCRSMKYNLIFTGIKEHRNENTEEVLRMFLSEELGLEEWFEFGNIVAKFLYNWQLDLVLDSARFLRGRQYGINRQFPQEIEQARRSLYPVMKQMRSEGKQVKLVRDMLFVDGELYEPNDASGIHDSPQAHASTRDEHLAAWGIRTPSHGESFLRTPTHRPNKRQRYGSTPENTSR